MTLVTNVAFILLRFGLSRLVAINVDTICHLASEYHHFLRLAAWTTWLGIAVVGALCPRQHEYILLLYTMKRIESFNEYYLIFFIECCCYYSQRLTTLQSFWWHRSTRLTERIDDRRILWRCCLCSWQSTIGPHGLSLWLGTVEVILRHGQQNHWMVLSLRWPAAAWRAAGLTQNKQWREPCAGEPPHCLCVRYFSGLTGQWCPLPSHQ